MFKKSTYSDLEIQEILDTLFQEKRKVKELELRLKNCTLSPPPAVGNSTAELEAKEKRVRELEMELSNSLRQNEAGLKLLNQAENAVALYEQKIATLKVELEEAINRPQNSLKEAQLERVIQFMRQKGEESSAEAQELQKKLSGLQETNEQLRIDLWQAKEVQQRLGETLQVERETKEDLLAEENALKSQLEQLKMSFSGLQSSIKTFSEDKQLLERDAKGYQESYINSQREIELLKQMMMKTLQEFKEERLKEEHSYKAQIDQLRDQIQKDQTKIVEWERTDLGRQEQGHHLQEQMISLEKQLSQKNVEMSALTLAQKELAQFTEELKQKLLRAEETKKHTIESLQKKEVEVENLNAQVANLARSLADIEEALQQAESERHEHESRLRVAQQHLAKKVREVTVLSEKNEEFKLNRLELENALESTRSKLLETQATLEAQAQHQQKLQEQYQDSIKAIESQTTKWEGKYFQIHERWQEVESRNRELKRLEERFTKLQNAFGHLSSLLGNPLSLIAPETIHTDSPPIKEYHDIDIAPPTPPCATIQQTLFEATKPVVRFKESLF